MPSYRRWYVPGGTYFFTVVTHHRQPILTTKTSREHLRTAILETQEKCAFEMVALVLLPDHLHCIWSLPVGDAGYSARWAKIKETFSRRFLNSGGREVLVNKSRLKHRERGVWQRRFWEHVIRDENDLIRCADYIHWNPIKHGYVDRVRDYPWSSFHRFVQTGDYEQDWGGGAEVDVSGAEWE
ncbi:MAG TPA: transposase [Gemmata sp.]|nr:transposase [Gemmata sp.]